MINGKCASKMCSLLIVTIVINICRVLSSCSKFCLSQPLEELVTSLLTSKTLYKLVCYNNHCFKGLVAESHRKRRSFPINEPRRSNNKVCFLLKAFCDNVREKTIHAPPSLILLLSRLCLDFHDSTIDYLVSNFL